MQYKLCSFGGMRQIFDHFKPIHLNWYWSSLRSRISSKFWLDPLSEILDTALSASVWFCDQGEGRFSSFPTVMYARYLAVFSGLIKLRGFLIGLQDERMSQYRPFSPKSFWKKKSIYFTLKNGTISNVFVEFYMSIVNEQMTATQFLCSKSPCTLNLQSI